MLWMLFNGCTFRSLFITPPLLMNTIMTKVLVHTPAVCTPEWDLPDWVSRSDKRHDAYPFAWHREPDSNIRPWAVHSSRGTPTRLHRRHSAPVSSAYSVRLRVRLYRTVTSASISQDRAPSCHRIIHVRRYVAGSWILGVNEPPAEASSPHRWSHRTREPWSRIEVVGLAGSCRFRPMLVVLTSVEPEGVGFTQSLAPITASYSTPSYAIAFHGSRSS